MMRHSVFAADEYLDEEDLLRGLGCQKNRCAAKAFRDALG